jgi:hypothetical protein
VAAIASDQRPLPCVSLPAQAKFIPGFFKMAATLLEDKDLSSLPGRIDPSYVPVQPAGSDVRDVSPSVRTRGRPCCVQH